MYARELETRTFETASRLVRLAFNVVEVNGSRRTNRTKAAVPRSTIDKLSTSELGAEYQRNNGIHDEDDCAGVNGAHDGKDG